MSFSFWEAHNARMQHSNYANDNLKFVLQFFLVCLRFVCKNGVVARGAAMWTQCKSTWKALIPCSKWHHYWSELSCYGRHWQCRKVWQCRGGWRKHKWPKNTQDAIGIVINQGHLLQEVLPIHAQEDTYMILLLGHKKYIDIISNVPIGWVLGVSSSLELCSSLQFYHFFVLICCCWLVFVCIIFVICLLPSDFAQPNHKN